MESGTFQFAPSDAREVARDQSEQHAATLEPLKHRHHAWAVLVGDVRAYSQVIPLRSSKYLRHRRADVFTRYASRAHHYSNYYRVEHTLDGDAFGGRLKPGDAADAVDQCSAVLRPRASNQGAVNVE